MDWRRAPSMAEPETVLSLVHPEDRAGLKKAFWDDVMEQGRLAHEFRVIWPDGSVHFLYSRGKVIRDDRGEPATMLGISVDITEQKRAAHELQRKLEQMQVLSGLAEAVNRAQEPAEIYRAALQGLTRAVGADRASVLIFDADDVIRFKAWSGLSDEYRAAVAGHTPWRRGAPDAQPIAVPDVLEDSSLSGLGPVLAKEGIRSRCLHSADGKWRGDREVHAVLQPAARVSGGGTPDRADHRHPCCFCDRTAECGDGIASQRGTVPRHFFSGGGGHHAGQPLGRTPAGERPLLRDTRLFAGRNARQDVFGNHPPGLPRGLSPRNPRTSGRARPRRTPRRNASCTRTAPPSGRG